MNKLVFYHFSKKVTICHNLPQRRMQRMYTKWMYKSGRTSPREFIASVNSNWFNMLMGYSAEIQKTMEVT